MNHNQFNGFRIYPVMYTHSKTRRCHASLFVYLEPDEMQSSTYRYNIFHIFAITKIIILKSPEE
jgi:hypothetical protein